MATSKKAPAKKSKPAKKAAAKKAAPKKAAPKKAAPKKAAKKTSKNNKLGVKNSLVNNINAKKKRGASRPKSKSTVSKKNFKAMEANWGDKE